jgi:hypothetical protein
VWGFYLWRESLANFDRLIGRPCKATTLTDGERSPRHGAGFIPDGCLCRPIEIAGLSGFSGFEEVPNCDGSPRTDRQLIKFVTR